MSDFLKNVVSVITTEIRFLMMKLIHGSRFKFSGIQRFSPGTDISIEKGASITLGKKVRAHTGTRIRARRGARIVIGDDVAFNYNCMITAHDEITIGSGCEIGPGVLFYDHDHDFHGCSVKEKKFRTAPINIGKNVWIGANCIILRGVNIGDNSVIGAGTVLKRDVPAGTCICADRMYKSWIYERVD